MAVSLALLFIYFIILGANFNGPYAFADVGLINHWFSGEPLPKETVLVEPRSVHEQEDGTILGICVTGKFWHNFLVYHSLLFCQFFTFFKDILMTSTWTGHIKC